VIKALLRFLDGVWIFFMRRVLIFLTHLIYRPKFYSVTGKKGRWRIAEPSVLTCNHLRGCDGAVISALFRRDRLHSLTATYWYHRWYLRPLLACGYSIPIGANSPSWLRSSVEVIQKGDSVLIFPEGAAVPGDGINPFRPGFLMLAHMADVPILPLYMEGCYNRPFIKRLRVVVGEPYRPEPPAEGEGMKQSYYDKQCELLYNKTMELRAFLHEKRKGKKHEKA